MNKLASISLLSTRPLIGHFAVFFLRLRSTSMMAKPFLRMILKLESGVRQIPDPPPPNGHGFRIKIRSEARFSFRSKRVELERAKGDIDIEFDTF